MPAIEMCPLCRWNWLERITPEHDDPYMYCASCDATFDLEDD